ncbi:MAG: enoyl-CoA hydratase/isomerase family protein [Proteobacteria bacterium]|nr:enoyl-CoA hydratase/isomerase family protein [Pseudomonadota bacterium]
MSPIDWRRDGAVAIVVMQKDDNTMNIDFVDGMFDVLDAILEDKDMTAVVITSGNKKNWSIGLDMNWLGTLIAENDVALLKRFMLRIDDMFKKILLYPLPVIAAINGHAFGSGAILSCACDFRFMKADKGYFCFPEIDLGIPFMPGQLAFCQKAIPVQKFQELLLTGKRAGAKELEACQAILKACADEAELFQEAIGFARSLHKKRGIFGEMKKRHNQPMVTKLENEDSKYIDSMAVLISD